ncbi:siroheme synthase CysG [Pseudovibrio sp. Tun.PSC04-5.I4]|uniref:siroheme synthase CysG n=1 Tax=Pseudovibrio sp. Tun.PSC04-5.I4 TaxID=1798213 RepID=UPI00088F7153|nr:siroheme synthase CysG [Pseudovibrio sp. Tun.PSC04-5.I4]SDR16206.1 uroporphyrinogen-III C-methyltransferase [Pseudovibrio sp. Tun.PSC04-5.I4]
MALVKSFEAQHDESNKLAVFPTFHKVEDKMVVVVGCGEEAAAKVRLLAQTKAHIRVVSPERPSDELADAVAKADGVFMLSAFNPTYLDGAVLVFAATDAEELDREIVEAAREKGIPVNAVDRPELCDFYTGAMVNRAPVAVAITSTGVGPVYARHIRAQVEAMLPREAGQLARLAESFRSTVGKLMPSGLARRRFWADFFSGSVAANTFAGETQKALSEAHRLLNGDQDTRGYVWLVGAGPGAEDLLTLRAQRVLQEADVIFYDALVPDAVVSMGRRDATRINVGKRKGTHSSTQTQINQLLVSAAKSGKRVVRLKAGDPMVFGRAGEEIAALRAHAVDFEVVPGVTAAFAAAASAQIPLTLRGVASTLVFATGHDQHGDTLPNWAEMALNGATTAVYMGRTVAGKVATLLAEAGMDLSTPVMAIENAAHAKERNFAGTLRDLCDFEHHDSVTGPTLIVIGKAVAHADMSRSFPLSPYKITSLQAVVAA